MLWSSSNLNDVQSGWNAAYSCATDPTGKCSCSNGDPNNLLAVNFAGPGYDLVTGWGSPTFGLLQLLSSGGVVRHVPISGTVQLNDCSCNGLDCTTSIASSTLPFSASCDVNVTNPTATFGVAPNELCNNELGVEISGTCTLKGDLSVDITATLSYFHGDSNTCGGGYLNSSWDIDMNVPAGQTGSPWIPPVQDDGTCWCAASILLGGPYPYTCHNGANYALTAGNQPG